ncbi:MAG TPA: hypothetical protein DCE81_08265 [Cytophagales bacterium]|nr:hypothetical protein [Cytophagales bacterium]
MKKLTILLLFVAGNALQAQPNQGVLIGQDTLNNVITTAVPFLTITPDARAAGMGEVGAALSPDANAAYWNAGKLAFIEQGYGVSASYTPWLGKIINDMYVFYLSGFYKISKERTVAASMKYFDLGEIQFNKGPDPGDQLGRYNPREFAFDVTYSQMLTQNLGIGGALRYIHSNLTGAVSGSVDARPGNTVAVDIGVYYTRPLVSSNASYSLAASITNIGGKISYSDATVKDFIPTNLRLGGIFTSELDAFSSLSFGLDVNKLMVPSPAPGSKDKSLISGMLGSFSDAAGGFSEEIREFMLSIGTEYWYNKTFAARLGYFNEARDKGNRKYLTFGLGFRKDKFGVDAAYLVPINKRENALAETLRFTVMMNFEARPEQEQSSAEN